MPRVVRFLNETTAIGPALGALNRIFAAASKELQIRFPLALIGGLSVSVWGAVRATQDIDLLADSEPSPIGEPALRDRLSNCFKRQRCRVDWRVGDHDDPIPLLMRIELPPRYSGMGADILWAHKRWMREALQRTILVKVGRNRIPVVHPEDLILLKLNAGGPQDLLDIQRLLEKPPPQLNLDRLKKSAAGMRLSRALERSLRETRS